MGKKKEYPPIQTRSFVHMGDQLVDTRDLNPEQKRRLADDLRLGVLRALFPNVDFWVEPTSDGQNADA